MGNVINEKNSLAVLEQDHILEKILDYLPVSDLLIAEKVSLRWKNACSNVWKLKKKLTFKLTQELVDYDNFEAILHKCGKFITRLEVFTTDSGACRRSEDNKRKICMKIIIPIGFYCKNLEHLLIRDLCCVDPEVFAFLSKCVSPRFTSFHLEGRVHGLSETNLEYVILQKATNLKSLSVSSDIDISTGNSLMKISNECEYLDISNCNIQSHKVPTILKRFTKLRTLLAAKVHGMKLLMPEISTIFPNLEQLDLSEITNITESEINQLCLLRNLKHLKVNRLKAVTPDAIISFAEILELEVFHCVGCPYVTNSAILRMIELCPNLRSLDLQSCDMISSNLMVEALFALKLRKNKIVLEIMTSIWEKNIPSKRRKILKNESRPLLIIKYYE